MARHSDSDTVIPLAAALITERKSEFSEVINFQDTLDQGTYHKAPQVTQTVEAVEVICNRKQLLYTIYNRTVFG